jgi:PKD repeat protein
VSFSAEAYDADGIKQYQWFFGDLAYAGGADVTHTYRAPGAYTAICYVTDRVGNTSWKTLQVEIK